MNIYFPGAGREKIIFEGMPGTGRSPIVGKGCELEVEFFGFLEQNRGLDAPGKIMCWVSHHGQEGSGCVQHKSLYDGTLKEHKGF